MLLIFVFCVLFIFIESAELAFPTNRVLKDDPFPNMGNKAFLKNRLLDNLNKFFGDSGGETLEILDADPGEKALDIEPPRAENPFETQFREQKLEPISPVNAIVNRPFPTLLPTTSSAAPVLATTTAQIPEKAVKIRNEGSVDSIKEWRRRIYKAFKGSRKKYTVRPTVQPEVITLNSTMPAVVDKNRQIIMSRRAPEWHRVEKKESMGRDPTGKLVPLFGAETNSYRIERLERMQQSGPAYSLPMPPQRNRVVYLPAPSSPPYLPPATIHFVTASAAPYTLPPMITPPSPPRVSPIPLLQEFAATTQRYNSYPATAYPTYAPVPNYPQNYNNMIPSQAITPYPPQTVTQTEEPDAFVEDNVMESEDEDPDEVFGTPMQTNNNCNQGCPQAAGQIISEEKCNSNRLRVIIQNNIVPHDAEASKRAVQLAAETETGLYFDAVCGTGFFSYIAHTDEFCLASSSGVNCYVFSPVCGSTSMAAMAFGKRRKSMAKKFLNKN